MTSIGWNSLKSSVLITPNNTIHMHFYSQNRISHIQNMFEISKSSLPTNWHKEQKEYILLKPWQSTWWGYSFTESHLSWSVRHCIWGDYPFTHALYLYHGVVWQWGECSFTVTNPEMFSHYVWGDYPFTCTIMDLCNNTIPRKLPLYSHHPQSV